MTVKTTLTASVLATGLALGMGATAVLAISAHGAAARSTHAGDNGKGQGADRSEARGDNGNHGSNSNAGGNSGDHGKPESPGSQGRGAIASQLKNLNAVCAISKSGEKASPKSNIGKIWFYKGKYDIAQTERGTLATMFSSLTVDTSSFAGLSVEDQIVAVADQIQALQDAKAAATLIEGTDAYDQALADYAAGLEPPVAVDALTQDQIDAFNATVEADNAAAAAQYDPQIAELQDYAAQLDVVDAAQQEEQAALKTAARGRDLSAEAIAALNDRIVNGC